MEPTEIVPEKSATLQRLSNVKEEQTIAQCIWYIKLLSSALTVITALCIAIIGVLSWHMVRSENNTNKLNGDAEKSTEDSMWLKVVSENSSADIRTLQATVKSQEEVIKTLETKINGPLITGSTFIRWGRPDCPGNDTDLVYPGYVGGGFFDHVGSAVNYLCLTMEPTWNHTTTIDDNAYLYGSEYEITARYFDQRLVDQKPPCAVCRSTRATVIMIPGTNVCTEGWTSEYAGYLVAGRFNKQAASEYICLDSSATIADGSNRTSHNGKLMYLVSAKCGALQCPPYADDLEVTCVVCTQ